MRTRAVANYLKKHVPGNPTVIIEFMAGAGGTKAANHLYRGARADGLIIGSAPSGMVSSAILGEAGVQYDLDKFIYLGSPNSESHHVFFTNRKLGLGSMKNCALTRDCGSAPRLLATRSTIPVACSL